jgi:glutamate N-acetyltransferase/amino-acid N-acetyltransferase
MSDVNKNFLPNGFWVNGIHCGIKRSKNRDLGLFYSFSPCIASGVFTSNQIKSASVLISQKHIRNKIRCIVANSGCANTATGKLGLRDAITMCDYVSKFIGFNESNSVLVASTGMIGEYLPMDKIKQGLEKLCNYLIDKKPYSINNAAESIMTTDTVPKIVSSKYNIGNSEIKIISFAKGSGMIHPSMATFLCFILTDCNISKRILDHALKSVVNNTFNMLSIDGVTSTNDTVFCLANGSAGNKKITEYNNDYRKFYLHLNYVCSEISKKIVSDGEGATKLIEINVINAKTKNDAKKIAEKIATSPLVKTAFFGNDANWGRVLTAVGMSGVRINPNKIDIYFNNYCLCKNSQLLDFSEKKVKKILDNKKVNMTVDLHTGKEKIKYYTCDLSFDYVKINAHYRT